MEQYMLTPVSQLMQQISQERKRYRQAIEEDRQFAEAKEIMHAVSVLETELESLSLRQELVVAGCN